MTIADIKALMQRGFNVLPVQPASKKPALDTWRELQERKVTDQEIREWWGKYPQLGVAVITGAISNVVVIDIDVKRGGDVDNLDLPPTLVAITPSGGRHYYYKHPGKVVRNSVDLLPGIDVRGDGGYVVAPPTPGYRWENPDAPIADLPTWVLELIASSDATTTSNSDDWYTELLKGVPQGQRDQAAVRLVGRWVRHGLSEEEVLALLLAWNKRNKPPMGQYPGDPDELTWARQKIASIFRREEQRRNLEQTPDSLLKQLEETDSLQHKLSIIKRLADALSTADEVTKEYYLNVASKAAGLRKSDLRKLLTKAVAPQNVKPVPLEKPRSSKALLSQDLQDGVFYYGLWLPTTPQAVSDEDFVFKWITSEGTCVDPPEQLMKILPPVDISRKWSVDGTTPYNVFDWLNGRRDLDAQQLLQEIAAVFDEFMWYPQPDTSLVLALWVMHTYVYTIYNYTAYMALSGAKRSGKSRTLTILQELAHNAYTTANASTASLARTIHSEQATVLMDEAEFHSLINAQGGVDDRLGLLLNSNMRGRMYMRVEGTELKPRCYDAYSPKVFATMNYLPDALADRAIPIQVGRPPLDHQKHYEDLVLEEQRERFQILRNKLYFFGLLYARRLSERTYEVLDLLRQYGVIDRERDIWLPLTAIALEIGGMELFERVIAYVKKAGQEKLQQEQESFTVAVLWACWTLLKDAVNEAVILPDRPTPPEGSAWFTADTIRRLVAGYYGVKEEDISTRRIGKELKQTGVITGDGDTARWWSRGAGSSRGYTVYLLDKDRVTDAALRYEVKEVTELFGEGDSP